MASERKHIRFSLLTLVVVLISTGRAFSEGPTEEWVARFDGPDSGYDVANDITVDGDGNVYLTGRCTNGNDDYATMKLNSTGTVEWVEYYDGPASGDDHGNAITLDGMGNVYVTGFIDGGGVTFNDYMTIKYSNDGNLLWTARFNGPGYYNDEAFDIAVGSDGSVYVTGTSDEDYATIKYNENGVQQWVAFYDGPGGDTDYPYSVAVDDSGSVFVTGGSYGDDGHWDSATIKYDNDGIEQWVSRYNGSGDYHDYAVDLLLDGNGYIYITGQCVGLDSEEDYLTIKYNSNGVEEWTAVYDGPGIPGDNDDNALSIAVDDSGNVYVTGRSYGSGTADDYATIKYDSSGTEQWVSRYNGSGYENDWGYSIAVDDMGCVYVTGASYAFDGTYDYATLKYNSDGIEQWAVTYNGPGDAYDHAKCIILDQEANIYVTGFSNGDGTGADFCTIKYSEMVGIAESEELEMSGFQLCPITPNPCSGSATISFSIPYLSVVSLRIYNLAGTLVDELAQGERSSGWHEISIHGLSPGVHFCMLQTGQETLMEKFLVLNP